MTTPQKQEVTTQKPTEPTTPERDIVLADIDDTNGLMWYQFEEGEGASILTSSLSQPRDSIQFYGSLTYEGGIDNTGYAQFEEGEGIKLNNTFTDWGQIQDHTFLHPAARELSVAFYMMPDSLDNTQMLFEYGSRYRGFALGIEAGYLYVSITASNSSETDGTQMPFDPIALPENCTSEWTHIFFTYDGTLDGGTATVYINFKKAAALSGVGGYLPKVLDASGVATTDHGSNSLLWDAAYYSGKIDDLRIYKDGFTELP
ncbi:MAG: LamG domain-containing protein, partial [Clostridia bacterium]|nr:LamG domain-containing protein [Clostridia bacterium]